LVSPASGSPFYFTNSGNTLYTLNIATGALTSIGPLGFSIGGLWDLAFGPNGNLYASSNGNLYQVNTSTGAGTLIGSFGGGLEMQSIIAADGVLYGFEGNGMYTINLTNATATFVRDTPAGLGNLDAEALVPGAAVPEPATWPLVLSGLALPAGLRLRRRRENA